MAQYNPSQVHDNFWVYALEQDLAARFPNQDGKWMMFFPMSEMDARWNEACQLYRSGRLVGVNSMKASTAKQNPMPQRLHAHDEGMIIFYCGPSEDEQNVREYGRNILNNMNYSRDTFYYKSDKPHLINPNKPYKHMYFINTLEHYSGIASGLARAPLRNNLAINNYLPVSNTSSLSVLSYSAPQYETEILNSYDSLYLNNSEIYY